ncbi:hypothetical protein CFC21_089083 [Triticum aestivum]|uniref:F-box domain-containing protein n=2 Tax=Triticum aestivum TaxID=4565 RepID=A0A9R1IKD3_WHEAT|nr:F-box/FBD/LRR-repeat protein At1g13570-like [Triticum aestivum]KAF7085683.1 hypothetical protein CFC21_089083 [Triticum aestivum]
MGAIVENFMDWLPSGGNAVAIAASLSAAVDYEGEDRISALPDDLLRNIVSRLPVRDAARTAAIASQWLHLWRSTPLVLSDVDLLPSTVARILADHPGPFQAIYIARCRFASHERELAEWPRLLAAKGIQDLVLVNDVIGSQFITDTMLLPADIFRCASLQRLFLGFFRFPDTVGLSRGPDVLPHLRELSMFTTVINTWDLDYMLACCPVLEKLAFVLSNSPDLIHLRSKSLQCVLLWFFTAEEVAVVDAPLLERLFLVDLAGSPQQPRDDSTMMIKIACAPSLRALGFLETRTHRLHIGDNAIKPGILPSPSTMLPGVKKLAVKVNFGVSKEVKMLVAFLGCFPNVDTLHIESLTEPTGRKHAKFWRELSTVECIESHVKKMVVHEYRGDQSELRFLKFISRRAEVLQTLYVLLNRESLTSVAKVRKMTRRLVALSRLTCCGDCQIMVLGPELQNDWSFQKASDITVDDPFHW